MTSLPRSIEMVLSARAARFLRLRPDRAASRLSSEAFLCQWRVDAADDSFGGRWFMVTNLGTLFTFLLPRQRTARFPDLVAAFRLRLRFALLAATPPLSWDFGEAVPVSGNPRAVVGSMNDMARLLARPRVPAAPIPHGDFESFLNRTPFSAIGTGSRYEIPAKLWLHRLNAIT